MAKQNTLHQLILSLTKSEKRFIKLNAQMHKGDKVYLKLMDSIGKQEEYNEQALLDEFEGEDFLKQFGVAKNYLQNFIMKQLRQYHSGLKANIECKNLLIDIEVMFWKGQYKLAEKLIHKTDKIASKYDLFLILEELNYWHGRIYSALLKLDKSSVKSASEKHQNNIAKYQNILDYYELRSQIQLLLKESEVIRDKTELQKYKNLLNNPLLADIKNAQSFYAKYVFYVMKGVIYSVLGENQKARDYQLQLYTFINKNKWFVEENSILYTAVLHNLIKESLINKDFNHFHIYLEQLKSLDVKMPHEKANIFSNLCLLELGYYLKNNEIEKAKDFVENTVKNYEGIEDILNKSHFYLLNYQTALIYFLLNQNNKALKWINKVINEPSKDLRVDIRCRAYIINIILHFELENIELLPYLVRTTLNYFKTIKTTRKIDEVFVSMFNTIPLNSSRKELIPFLENKKEELSIIKRDSVIVTTTDYFDWIDSKIQNISIYDYIKQNKD